MVEKRHGKFGNISEKEKFPTEIGNSREGRKDMHRQQ